jgi:hypothetical protein
VLLLLGVFLFEEDLARERFLLTLMTRMRSSWLRSASRFRTGRTSTCEPGRKARTPMSTARPPLIRSMTRPMTTFFSA